MIKLILLAVLAVSVIAAASSSEAQFVADRQVTPQSRGLVPVKYIDDYGHWLQASTRRCRRYVRTNDWQLD